MNHWKTILKAGSEGGAITLYGQYNGQHWLFRKAFLDQTPTRMDAPARHSCAEQVDSWEAALQTLERYPWHLFYPLEVHPVFKGAVLAAVFRRSRPDLMTDDYGFRQWLQICSELPRVEWKLAL